GSGDPPSPGRNGERHFHGEQRSNETHSSTTDPEAKLTKKGKGKEAKLAYTGNVMTENRNGFVVEAELRQVSGMVERETAKDMIVRYSPGAKRITVGADKGFDTADFVSDMRDFNVTPHVAQNTTNRLGLLGIEVEHVLHAGDVIGIDLRNAPHVLAPRLEVIFGQTPAHRLAGDTIVLGELDQFTGQQLQCPTAAACRWLGTGGGDEQGLLLAR